MKKLFLTAIILLGSFTACVKSTTPKPTILEVSPATLEFTKEGGTQKFTITTNGKWEILGGEGLTLEPADGKGNLAVKVTMVASQTEEVITKTLTVKSGTLKKTVTVTQASALATSLEVLPATLEFAKEGGTEEFTITADGKWEILGGEGLTLEPADGKGEGNLAVKVTMVANQTEEVITKTLTVKSGTLEKTVTVTQASALATSLEVSPATLAFTSNGGTQEFEVTADGKWEILGGEGLTLDPADGKGEGNLVVKVTMAVNQTGGDITKTLTVKSGTLEKTVTVTQRIKSDIHVDPAGTLATILDADPSLKTAAKLVITGTMDEADFTALKTAASGTLTQLDIRDLNTTALPANAFNNYTALENIDLPTSLTSIENYSFFGCKALTAITIPYGVESIGDGAFGECLTLSAVVLGENSSLTSIGEWAFLSCKALTTIALPTSVTSIGAGIFAGCTTLNNITIPASVTSIVEYAFQNCTSLKEITIPDKIESIGSYSFQNCTVLKSITLPASVKSIENSVFWGCTALKSVTLPPDGVTSIGNNTFDTCSALTSITIPSGVTSIAAYMFNNCTALTSVTIPDGVTSIAGYAFANCKALKSITIPASVKSIENSVFYVCTALTSITIPDGVTSIGDFAFFNCTVLKSIALPASIKSIGTQTFSGCTTLNSVSCLATTPPTLATNGFANTPTTKILKVPATSVDTYKANTTWVASFPVDQISAIQ